MTLLARGQVKVDADKARDKLRDHMLVDLDLYTTEIARAATALGARALHLRWDIDDVELTTDALGERAPSVDDLASIRDRLLSSERDAHGVALRLLGLGVNAALGLGPAFVEVSVEDTALRFHRDGSVQRRALAAPLEAGALRVQVRRRLGLDLVKRGLRPDLPRSLRYLLERAHHSSLALSVNGAPIAEAAPVMRVPLRESGSVRSWLIVPAEGPRTCRTLLLERGIEIARYDFIGRSEQLWTGDVPLQVVVDAERLPTNASRSAVRFEDTTMRGVLADVEHGLDQLLDRLEQDPREEARAALGAIGSWFAVRQRAGEPLTARHQHVLSLPLLRSAYDQPLAIGAVRGGDVEQPVLVHRGDAPIEPELADLVGPAVWLRGHPAERWLSALCTVSADQRIHRARLGRERRARALAHPAREVALTGSIRHLLRESFRVERGAFAGLRGEVALHRSNGEVDTSVVHVWVDGHPIESIPLADTLLPFEIALTWPERLAPNLDYAGVERTSDLRAALGYAWGLAAYAVATSAEHLPLARLAFESWLRASNARGERVRSLPRALDQARIWPCADGSWVSAKVVREYAQEKKAVCIARGAGPTLPDARPVLSMPECHALVARLGKTTSVDYSSLLAHANDVLPASDPFVGLPFGEAPLHGFVALGSGRMRVFHLGRLLSETKRGSRYGDVDLTLDDQAAVVNPNGRGALWTTPRLRLGDAEDSLLIAMLDRVEAEAPRSARPGPDVVRYLEQSADRIDARRALAQGPRPRGDVPAVRDRIGALLARFERERQIDAKVAALSRAAVALPAVSADEGRVEDGSGVVVVRLPNAQRAPVHVLSFRGHLFGQHALTTLPVSSYVDLHDEALVAPSWNDVDDAGRNWAERAILEACVQLLGRLVVRGAFASDLPSLELGTALTLEPGIDLGVLRATLAQVAWPTITGQVTHLHEDTTELTVGRIAYASYAPPAEGHDPDVVWLPDNALGVARRLLFGHLGVTLHDVTARVADTQKLRATLQRESPLCHDTFGREHSIVTLLPRGDVLFTLDPNHAGLALEDRDSPIMLLDLHRLASLREVSKLLGKGALIDAAPWLEQERAARRKRAIVIDAPDRLSAAQREDCVRTESVNWKHLRMRGEIGLLREPGRPPYSVRVRSGGHPLCELKLEAAHVPAFVAVVSLDRVRATRAFDGFEHRADEARLRSAVLASVRMMAKEPQLAAPAARGTAKSPADGALDDAALDEILLEVALEVEPTIDVVVEDPSEPHADEIIVDVEEPAPEPFLLGLWRKAVAAWSRPILPADASVLDRLAERIASMQLIGADLTRITPSEIGRPLEFDPEHGELRVNLHHTSICALAGHEYGLSQLALSALSEINRERGAVTDAHERAILLDALERLAEPSD